MSSCWRWWSGGCIRTTSGASSRSSARGSSASDPQLPRGLTEQQRDVLAGPPALDAAQNVRREGVAVAGALPAEPPCIDETSKPGRRVAAIHRFDEVEERVERDPRHRHDE